jgi:hypothetical protein
MNNPLFIVCESEKEHKGNILLKNIEKFNKISLVL